jgi:predicted lipoprotein with Yx(FWY)xxD motif
MRPTNRLLSFAGVATAALLFAAACTSAATTPTATVLSATDVPTMAPAATPAAAAVTVGVTNDPKLGAYFTGANGMTLYIFMGDKPDVSSCSGSCATNWPALTAAAGTSITPPTGAMGDFSLITRPDGATQVAYNHQPLYYFAGDSVAGDTKGQGINGRWFVAPLTGAPAATPTDAPTPRAVRTPKATVGY